MRSAVGYSDEFTVITFAPKSAMRFSSATRSTLESHDAMASAVSWPTPFTARSAARPAARMRCGVSNVSSSARSRTGPIPGTMLRAMQASVSVTRAVYRLRAVMQVLRRIARERGERVEVVRDLRFFDEEIRAVATDAQFAVLLHARRTRVPRFSATGPVSDGTSTATFRK